MYKADLLQQLPKQVFDEIVHLVNKKLADKVDLINLGQGNPDQATPPHIIQALQLAAQQPHNHKYPSPFSGKMALKTAVAECYAREYQVELDPATEVAVLFGSKIGLIELPLCLLNPGDTMLLPDPGYPDYLSAVSLARVNYASMPLLEANNFLPNYAELDQAIVNQAKLMYLNYPNNPTGAVADQEFFERTLAFARENNIIVAHDFAYGAIGFSQRPPSFLSIAGAKQQGVEFYTLSKTYNMAGWRIGFAVGNAAIIAALDLLQGHLFAGIPPAIQDAAIAALSGDQSSVEQLVSLYKQRLATFLTASKKIGWQAYIPQGSFFLWMKVPAPYTSVDFAQMLLELADIVVLPGTAFGSCGEGYVRVSLLEPQARLVQAVERVAKLGLFQY